MKTTAWAIARVIVAMKAQLLADAFGLTAMLMNLFGSGTPAA